MREEIENFIKNCTTCNKGKINRKNRDYPLTITQTPQRPFQHINMDILDVHPQLHLLTLVDNFSKLGQAYPIENKQAKSIVQKVLLYFQHYPIPQRIHTDAGPEFINESVTALTDSG